MASAPRLVFSSHFKAQRQTLCDGQVEVVTRRGVRGQERLLIEGIEAAPGARVLCLLSADGITPLALAAARPELAITAVDIDAYQSRRVAALKSAHPGLRLAVRVAADVRELGQRYDVATLSWTRDGDRQLGRVLFEQVRRVLEPNGALYVAMDGGADDWLRRALKESFGVQPTRLEHHRRRGVLWKVINKKPTDEPLKDRGRSIRITAHGLDLELQTLPGNFAHGRLDAGTRALLEAARIAPDERVVDLGCGAGALGLSAAALAPLGQALLVDASARATLACARNRERLGLENAEVALRADLEELPEIPGGATLVLANPPYYSKLRIAERFVTCARELLAPTGRLLLVAKALEAHARIAADIFPAVATREVGGYGIVIAYDEAEPPELEDQSSS